MAKIIIPVVLLVAVCALAALSAWFLFTVLKTLIGVPLQAVLKIRGDAVLENDPRNTPRNPDLLRLRHLTRVVSSQKPQQPQVIPPRRVTYRSILGFLPYRHVPMFDLEDEMEFFVAEQTQQRTQNGFFTVQHLTASQRVSEVPLLDDLAGLQQPAPVTIDKAVETALATTAAYPHDGLVPFQEERIPDLGQIPGVFDVPEPILKLPLWPGPLAVLNGFVRSANADKIKAYEAAYKVWSKLQDEYNDAREELRAALVGLQKQLAASNDEQSANWREANVALATDRAEWGSRQNAEIGLLRTTLDSWHMGYLDDPAGLAKLVLDFTLFPRWLPMDVAANFDAESAVLIVDTEFPDVGQIVWQKRLGEKLKPATKRESKEANERLYPAIAIRYAWEVARAVNDNLVKTIVLNGWADYIDRTTGETKRAYVSSLLADVNKLRQLNLPAIDVVQAFTALKGVSARAQTVVPVAPIVAMNTSDRRFVDPRDVLDGVSSEQNLATMDWEDFEHLCRQLFEQEFASDGAEVKITQASRDAGVDAVIFNPDPVKGGKIVVQAKRYAGTVDVSAVRDLYGTVHNEGAMKGILVTTSTFGSDAYNFVANKPLTLINGGQLLHLLESHGYKFRIDLTEAKRAARERWSPRKERAD